MYSVARLCPDQSFLSLCHRRHVAGLCMFYKVISDSNHCLFSELPSASNRVRLIRAAATAHPLEFEVSRCRTSQFTRCFLPALVRMSNDPPYTVFDTGTSVGFRGAVNRWLLSRVVFFSLPWRRCLWGCEFSNFQTIWFSHLCLCC